MALVIFCVALVAAMRTRMSLRLAIFGRQRTDDRRRTKLPPAFHHVSSVLRALSSVFRRPSCERLGIAVDRSLELGGGRVGQVARLADVIEDVGTLVARQREQALLEG